MPLELEVMKGKRKGGNCLSRHPKSSKWLVQALFLLHVLSSVFHVRLRNMAFPDSLLHPLSFWLLYTVKDKSVFCSIYRHRSVKMGINLFLIFFFNYFLYESENNQ